MADVVALLNMKGGVGKTTLAVNLAWHTYRHGRKRVLLVDLDPQFNASQYLMDYRVYERHVRENGTLADLLIEQPRLRLRKKAKKRSVQNCIAHLEGGGSTGAFFDFLPAELTLAHVVKNPAQMEYKLEKILSPLREKYDYIFVDCAPTDSVLTTMALTASDFLLVPIRPDRFSILGFGNLRETLTQFRESSNDPHHVREIGIVFTQVRGESDVERECMQEIRTLAENHDSFVFSSVLGWSNTFIRAIEQQTPAFATKYARSDLKQEITAIVREMKARIEQFRES